MNQKRLLCVTAGDAGFFDLLQGCLRSQRDLRSHVEPSIAFFDLDCNEEQLSWLNSHVDFIRKPEWAFDFPGREKAPHYLRGLLARPGIRDYFPGFETYMWLDADTWMQTPEALDLLERGARRKGLAIVAELDRGSWLPFGGMPASWQTAQVWHEATFDAATARQLRSFPTLNAGVFALHRDAPHWEAWQRWTMIALQRGANLLTDQIALNRAIYQGLLPQTELLPAWCNWTCHAGMPAWDPERELLVEPYLPHHPISILHLTTSPKPTEARLRGAWRVEGGEKNAEEPHGITEREFMVSMRYEGRGAQWSGERGECLGSGERPERAEIVPTSFPAGDYVSPGLAVVRADRYFPNMVAGDKAACAWSYLRRDVPHTWYVDRRAPGIGFLSRDEAHILYNTALRFRGLPALELGCWFGWSTCHLALAGVLLDVVDPILSRPEVIGSVRQSLGEARVLGCVNLVAGSSPRMVHELAQQNRRPWSLFFIDGDHKHPGPLQDARVCVEYAAEDALILLHDLVCPDVAEALDYLRINGWQTRVYQTMQIMGVAWRGKVTPVEHVADGRIVARGLSV